MINLIHGDCMDLIASKPDGYYDLAIVDPPYGIGGDKQINFGSTKKTLHPPKNWDYAIPKESYFLELFRVSKNQIIWGGNYFISHLRNTPCFLVWDKMNGGNNLADCEIAWTSFKSPVRQFTHHIFSGIGNSNYKSIHPTQKPVSLYKWLLKNYAKPNDKILDTHGGSFSHAIACHDLGFDLDIIELDKDYYEAGKKRYETHISQLRMF